jgi:hypothetical protein
MGGIIEGITPHIRIPEERLFWFRFNRRGEGGDE